MKSGNNTDPVKLWELRSEGADATRWLESVRLRDNTWRRVYTPNTFIGVLIEIIGCVTLCSTIYVAPVHVCRVALHRGSAVRSPATLVHVDVSLGKKLNPKFAPVPTVCECFADVQVEP